tara:strand:- start:9930 stop:10094 length:165 start_codon:yes stop_codon:yes gene_type:complete
MNREFAFKSIPRALAKQILASRRNIIFSRGENERIDENALPLHFLKNSERDTFH